MNPGSVKIVYRVSAVEAIKRLNLPSESCLRVYRNPYPIFTKQIKALATDDELKKLQVELIAQPDKGNLIPGTGGLRKVKMAARGQGKSDSVQVIYFLATAEIIYLVLAYPKNVKDNLTNTEKAELKKLTKLLKDEV